jgi:quercetin dioxygenase-like cupin family protein
MTNSGYFEDERGTIEDLLAGPIDSVTEIFTRKGAVRGNHIHAETIQWTYVIDGKLLVAFRIPGEQVIRECEYAPGELVLEQAGVPHAWKALENTHVLVFTRGPRSGANYESDTQRLAPGERLIP